MKTFDRHGNRVYNRAVDKDRFWLNDRWPIGTWMQKRLLTIRITEASDRLGMTGLIEVCYPFVREQNGGHNEHPTSSNHV